MHHVEGSGEAMRIIHACHAFRDPLQTFVGKKHVSKVIGLPGKSDGQGNKLAEDGFALHPEPEDVAHGPIIQTLEMFAILFV